MTTAFHVAEYGQSEVMAIVLSTDGAESVHDGAEGLASEAERVGRESAPPRSGWLDELDRLKGGWLWF